MSHRRIIGAGAVVAAALTVLVVPQALAQDVKIVGADSKTAIAGSYVVVLKDDVVKADAVAAKVNAEVKLRYTKVFNGFAAKMTAEAAKKLALDPAVKTVAQDQVFKKTNNVQTSVPSWGIDRIDQRTNILTDAYGYRTDASNVHAYVLDTGIRVSHPEFGGRAKFEINTTGDSINDDCEGHGTHVAGTVGGTTVGVAKAVKLHAVKVLNCNGRGTLGGVIGGIDWVTANAIKPAVANMSLSGLANSLLDDAVRKSIAAGITYSIASGNGDEFGNGLDACGFSPGRVTEAITVNSVDRGETRSVWSNFGGCTDIFAPGEQISSAWVEGGLVESDGTSMAAPHVAGAAALHLATNPTATPAQVQQFLADSATKDIIRDTKGSPNRYLRVNGEPDLTPAADRVVPNGELGPDQRITSPNGRHILVLQLDGNLVLYSDGQPKFASNTPGSNATRFVLQGDGNLVLYTAENRAVWASNTDQTTATRLVLQDNGQAVLFGESYHRFWVSHNV